MRNMNGLLEVVIDNMLELCGPLMDSYLKESGKDIVSKLNRSKVTSLLMQGSTPGLLYQVTMVQNIP